MSAGNRRSVLGVTLSPDEHLMRHIGRTWASMARRLSSSERMDVVDDGGLNVTSSLRSPGDLRLVVQALLTSDAAMARLDRLRDREFPATASIYLTVPSVTGYGVSMSGDYDVHPYVSHRIGLVFKKFGPGLDDVGLLTVRVEHDDATAVWLDDAGGPTIDDLIGLEHGPSPMTEVPSVERAARDLSRRVAERRQRDGNPNGSGGAVCAPDPGPDFEF